MYNTEYRITTDYKQNIEHHQKDCAKWPGGFYP